MASDNSTDKNTVFRKLKAKSENKILQQWRLDRKIMSFGGNNRAQVFFKQHGWTDGGKIEAKYTSRAADLYRQLLAKEVAKSMANDAGLPSSPVAAPSAQSTNGLPDVSMSKPPNEISFEKQETVKTTSSPIASNIILSSTVKKPIGARKTGKTGLGDRKLTSKPSDSLYEQKHEEPVAPVSSSTNNTPMAWPALTSRFEYVDNVQSSEGNTEGAHAIAHVLPPKSSKFFADFGMDSGFPKNSGSRSSKVQVTIPNTSAISSSDLFGIDSVNTVDVIASDMINRLSFQAQ